MKNIHQLIIMPLITIVLLGCSQDSSQVGWKLVNSGTEAHLYGIHFGDDKRGWAVGSNDVILSTKNGGKTWKETETDSPAENTYTHVNFTSSKHGWLTSIGKVSYTGSGGNSWSVQYKERAIGRKAAGILDLYFVTETEGWAVGGFGTILHTQNGGGKWDKIQTFSDKHLWGVFFLDTDHGWIVGEEGEILHTQDGGKQWIRQESNVEQPLFSLHFVDQSNGWIVGTDGRILNTADGGKTWNPQKNPLKQSLRDVEFQTEKEGWAVGEEGLILHTNDGGISWSRYPSTTTHNLQDIFFSKKTGWIVGAHGTILMMKFELFGINSNLDNIHKTY